jgi:hypothetical protein
VGAEKSTSTRLSRRKLLRQILGGSVWAPVTLARSADSDGLSPEDSQFLEELAKVRFPVLWEQANYETGNVSDA